MTAQSSSSLAVSDRQWQWVFKLGGVAALIGVAIIPIQIIVYMVSPPPSEINDWFILFKNSPILGLLNSDLLYLINNLLLIPVYFALYVALKPICEPIVVAAFGLGLVGIAAYFPSNTAFEMLSLSQQYTVAATAAEQSLLLAAGQAVIVHNEGSAFLVYYVLNAISLLLFAGVMLHSSVFSRSTAYAGLAAGILMVVPSTFGTIGLIFAFLSLFPWAIFSILIARRLFQLGRNHQQSEAEIGLEHRLRKAN